MPWIVSFVHLSLARALYWYLAAHSIPAGLSLWVTLRASSRVFYRSPKSHRLWPVVDTHIGVFLQDILYDYVFASEKQLPCFMKTTWSTLRYKYQPAIQFWREMHLSMNWAFSKVLFSQLNHSLFHHLNSRDLRSHKTGFHYGKTHMCLKPSSIDAWSITIHDKPFVNWSARFLDVWV
jgi:hypothetical protein